jgi:hypothetical protein
VGLCSGAYDALQAALREPRVTGLVMLDIPGPFQNWLYAASHLAKWAKRRGSWRQPVKRVVGLAGKVRSATQARNAAAAPSFVEGVRPQSTRELMGAQLETLLARSLKMLFVFTPGVPANYNHRDLFRYTFPRAAAHPAVSFEYLPTSDHTFSARRSREQVMTLIRDWAVKLLNG